MTVTLSLTKLKVTRYLNVQGSKLQISQAANVPYARALDNPMRSRDFVINQGRGDYARRFARARLTRDRGLPPPVRMTTPGAMHGHRRARVRRVPTGSSSVESYPAPCALRPCLT